MYNFIPKRVFFTKGVGVHKEKLASFEEALRKAGIAHFNLVTVSSILPPHCKISQKAPCLNDMQPGQIVFTVLARNATDEHRRLVSASIGLAQPKDKNRYGYLSEHHSFGETNEVVGDYSEDLAASMLASTLGVEFDAAKAWDEKKEIFKVSGLIIKTQNTTQTAIGVKGLWTTTIAAAVFVM